MEQGKGKRSGAVVKGGQGAVLSRVVKLTH